MTIFNDKISYQQSDNKENHHELVTQQDPPEFNEETSILWQETFNAISDMITIQDKDFRIIKVNKAYAAAFKKDSKDLLGCKCYELIHGTTEPLKQCPHQQAITSNRTSTMEYYESHLDMEVAVSCAPIFDKAGMVRGTVHIMKDISERKRSEKKITEALHLAHQHEAEISAFLKASNAVMSYRDFKSSARVIFDVCKDLIGAVSGYVALLSSDGDENEVLFLDSGGLPGPVNPLFPIPIRGPRGEAYKKGETVFDNNFSQSALMQSMPSGHVKLDNVLFAPMILDGKVIGLLGLANKPGGFTEHDVTLAHSFGDIAAIALKNSRLFESLQKSERRYARAGEIALFGHWELNFFSGNAFFSPETLAIFGIPNNKLLSFIDFLQLVIPSDREMVSQTIDQAREQGGLINIEYRLKRSDNQQTIHIHSIAEIIQNAEGKIVSLAGTIHDITARRKSEQELAKYREQLETLVDERTVELHRMNKDLQLEIKNTLLAEKKLKSERDRAQTYLDIAGTMFVAINRKGEVTLINKKGCQILGYTESEIIGKNWFECFIPENEKIEQLVLAHRLINDKKDTITYHEHLVLTKNGDQRLIAWHNVLLRNTQGRIISHLSSGEDITEQRIYENAIKESEERFRQFADNVHEVFWIKDSNQNHLLYVNRAFSYIYGRSIKEFYNNPDLLMEVIAEEDRERVKPKLDSPITKRDLQYRIVHIDGSIHWVRDRTFPIKNKQGNIYRLVGIISDITEHKEAEEKERVHQEQLIQADKMASIGMMVSGVAHEINNPNNMIMLNTDIMKTAWKYFSPAILSNREALGITDIGGLSIGKIVDKFTSLLKGIASGSHRIKTIVESLKDFARIDPGKIDDGIAIVKVVESAVLITRNLIKKSTNHFTIHHGENVPLIRGNYQKLEQVIINLLSNSCNALTNREDTITLKTQYHENQQKVSIEVIDTGRGIPKVHMNKIMDPFYTTRRDIGGTGLGLAISYKIIQDHKGKLEFSSQEGEGTTVKVILPVVRGVDH